jgi:hypothetical protein
MFGPFGSLKICVGMGVGVGALAACASARRCPPVAEPHNGLPAYLVRSQSVPSVLHQRVIVVCTLFLNYGDGCFTSG